MAAADHARLAQSSTVCTLYLPSRHVPHPSDRANQPPSPATWLDGCGKTTPFVFNNKPSCHAPRPSCAAASVVSLGSTRDPTPATVSRAFHYTHSMPGAAG